MKPDDRRAVADRLDDLALGLICRAAPAAVDGFLVVLQAEAIAGERGSFFSRRKRCLTLRSRAATTSARLCRARGGAGLLLRGTASPSGLGSREPQAAVPKKGVLLRSCQRRLP